MKNLKRTNKSFTLIEVVTVIVVVSVIATLALVIYDKIYEEQIWMKARQSLLLIHSAAQVYKIKHDDFPDQGGFEELAWINSTFNVNIAADGFRIYYSYQGGNSVVDAIRVYRGSSIDNYWFRLRLNTPIFSSAASPNPVCMDGQSSGTRWKCPRYFPAF